MVEKFYYFKTKHMFFPKNAGSTVANDTKNTPKRPKFRQ